MLPDTKLHSGQEMLYKNQSKGNNSKTEQGRVKQGSTWKRLHLGLIFKTKRQHTILFVRGRSVA